MVFIIFFNLSRLIGIRIVHANKWCAESYTVLGSTVQCTETLFALLALSCRALHVAVSDVDFE